MKLKFFVIALAAGFGIFSMLEAKEKETTPSGVVKAFHSAMAKADFAAAKKHLAAKELIQMISFVEEMIKVSPELKEDTKKEFAQMAAAKFLSEKITGDKAAVVISYQEKGKTKKSTFNLKKDQGRWVITD